MTQEPDTYQSEEQEREFTPKQLAFFNAYFDPKSDTFGNGVQSALKAGYSENYANKITANTNAWLEEGKKRRTKMFNKAEKNLDEALDLETGVIRSKDGRIEQADDLDIMKIKIDVSKFIAKTLGKDEGYSERTEMTGKNGGDLVIKWENDADNNHSVPTENVGKGISPEPQAVEDSSASPESGQDNRVPEPPPAGRAQNTPE